MGKTKSSKKCAAHNTNSRTICAPYPNIARTQLVEFRANTYQTVPPKWKILLENAIQYDDMIQRIEKFKQWVVGYRIEIGLFSMEVVDTRAVMIQYRYVDSAPECIDVDDDVIDSLLEILGKFRAI